MNIPLANGSDASRPLTHAPTALLAAACLCGCGGPASIEQPAAPAVPDDPVGTADVCSVEQNAAGWQTLACPEGLLCVGDLNSMVDFVVPLAGGGRPDWSPDGRRIVFHRGLGAAGNEVLVINADGSDEVMLAAGSDPDWSPDGRKIAFVNDDGTGLMTLLPHDAVADTDTGLNAPAWSPDAQRIVFDRLGDGDLRPTQLYVMNADGTHARRLTPAQGLQSFELNPAWSPDGGRIAFLGLAGLATVDAAGGVPTAIEEDADTLFSADWFPDGCRLAYTESGTCGPAGLAIVGADGGASQSLLEGARDPAVSPDGTRIAFASSSDAFPLVIGPASVYVREDLDSAGSRSRYSRPGKE